MKRKQRLDAMAGTGRWRSWLLAASLPLALALAACSSDAPQPSTVAPQDTSNAPYPNLATVPDKPPPVSPEEIRANTAEGLAADRANAQYTGTLTAEGTAQPAASPPGPPPPEPVVEVSQRQVTETEVTAGGVVETEVDETEIRKTEVENGVETVTEVDETEVTETATSGQSMVEAEVTETQVSETQVSETQVSETMTPTPAPSTTTSGGVTEVSSLAEVCRVAEEWERKAYGCDNLPAADSTPAPTPSTAPSTAPSTTPAAPAPSPTTAPAAPLPTTQPAPPPPAYSPTPPTPAPGSPQVATQSPTAEQEPLSISPPVGGTQPAPQTTTQPPPPPPPAATPPSPPGVAAPLPVTAPAPAPAPAPMPAPAPATVVEQPPLVPPQGTVGSGRVELVGVIFFAHGSAALDGRDAQVLAQIAQLHKQYGGIIRVIGNASARTGTLSQVEHELANFEVSMERAGAVAAKLASSGVASTSIIVEARSDNQPIYHEFMPTGEAGNRRAEIYLEY